MLSTPTQKTSQTLPLLHFYTATHATTWAYQADAQALLAAATPWRQQHAIKPAGADRRKIHLLLIDVQKDFCFPQGTLYVGGRNGTGAMDDSDRIATFIYRHLPYITDITCTMDTHFPYQIFSPAFWLDVNDQAPAPHTQVNTEQIRSGALRPNPAVAWWLAAATISGCNGRWSSTVLSWNALASTPSICGHRTAYSAPMAMPWRVSSMRHGCFTPLCGAPKPGWKSKAAMP